MEKYTGYDILRKTITIDGVPKRIVKTFLGSNLVWTEFYFDLSSDTVTLDWEGHEENITLSTNYGWTIS